MPAQLSVGFDLDMTLIDTAPGFGTVLEVLGDELGVGFPVAELTARLGPPLDADLAESVLATVAAAGFPVVEIDPRRFRSGSLNELPPITPPEARNPVGPGRTRDIGLGAARDTGSRR